MASLFACTSKIICRRTLHAIYGEFEACISIDTGEITEGRLPMRALRLVKEWTELHRAELTRNWERGQNGELLEKIEGLDANQGN